MDNYNWKNDPLFQKMPMEKMDFITTLLGEVDTKNKNELMPFLLSITTRANEKGIQFTDTETDFIVSNISKHMSPAERKKIDTLRRVSQMLAKKSK